MEDGRWREDLRTPANATNRSEPAVAFMGRTGAAVWPLVQGETLPSPGGGASVGFAPGVVKNLPSPLPLQDVVQQHVVLHVLINLCIFTILSPICFWFASLCI